MQKPPNQDERGFYVTGFVFFPGSVDGCPFARDGAYLGKRISSRRPILDKCWARKSFVRSGATGIGGGVLERSY